MEQRPHRTPGDKPHGPQDEQLNAADIDLTGAIRQDDALTDVIDDAITEAEAADGEIPDWGARTMARALANEREDPMSGALHHFAVTGRADPEAMASELAELYQSTDDGDIREWVNWLGTYVARLPGKAGQIAQAATQDSTEVRSDPSSTTQVQLGIRGHGDAFRAYLQLPDVDPHAADLLQGFHHSYSGSYDSMIELLAEMRGEMADAKGEDAIPGADLDTAALERAARAAWDIVEICGRLYLFGK